MILCVNLDLANDHVNRVVIIRKCAAWVCFHLPRRWPLINPNSIILTSPNAFALKKEKVNDMWFQRILYYPALNGWLDFSLIVETMKRLLFAFKAKCVHKLDVNSIILKNAFTNISSEVAKKSVFCRICPLMSLPPFSLGPVHPLPWVLKCYQLAQMWNLKLDLDSLFINSILPLTPCGAHHSPTAPSWLMSSAPNQDAHRFLSD